MTTTQHHDICTDELCKITGRCADFDDGWQAGKDKREFEVIHGLGDNHAVYRRLSHQWAFDSAKIGMVSEIGAEWADAHPNELDGYIWLILEVDAITTLFEQQLYGLAIAQAFHAGVLAGRQLVDYLGMEAPDAARCEHGITLDNLIPCARCTERVQA